MYSDAEEFKLEKIKMRAGVENNEAKFSKKVSLRSFILVKFMIKT